MRKSFGAWLLAVGGLAGISPAASGTPGHCGFCRYPRPCVTPDQCVPGRASRASSVSAGRSRQHEQVCYRPVYKTCYQAADLHHLQHRHETNYVRREVHGAAAGDRVLRHGADYTVQRPVYETHLQEQRYTVMRPVTRRSRSRFRTAPTGRSTSSTSASVPYTVQPPGGAGVPGRDPVLHAAGRSTSSTSAPTPTP